MRIKPERLGQIKYWTDLFFRYKVTCHVIGAPRKHIFRIIEYLGELTDRQENYFDLGAILGYFRVYGTETEYNSYTCTY
jgi:hypothetical protein